MPGTPATILIVDDEADVSRYLAAALEDEGYRAIVAPDAGSGLRLIEEERPDLVCLDLVLPGATGMSLYREIRQDARFASVPIVVVTGIARADAAEKLGFGGRMPAPEGFVEKPVDVSRLRTIVRDLLAARERT